MFEGNSINKRDRAGWWSPRRPHDPSNYPFFYGWVILVVSTLGMCVSMPGQTIGVSVFNTRLSGALGLDSVQLSAAYMIGTLLSATLLGRGGRFFDSAGARKSLVASTVALGLVLLLLSECDRITKGFEATGLFGERDGLAGFIVLSAGFCLLRFTGQGMVTMSSRAMLGKWFERRRGLTAALSGVVVSFAFAGSPLIFEYLIRSFGWKGAWQVMGVAILLVFAALFWAFARDNPEECGLEMDGGRGPGKANTNQDAVVHREFTREEATRTYSLWAFNLMFGLHGLVATAYAFHILAIGEELGVSSDFILQLFLPMAGVSVISSLLVGWIADRTRVKYLLAFMAAAATVGYGTLAVGSYPDAAWLLVLSFGMTGGCFGSLSALVWPRFYGRRHLGSVSGLFMTVIVVASAIGPILFSLADSMLGAYRAGFAVCAILAAALVAGALRADNPQRRHAPPVES